MQAPFFSPVFPPCDVPPLRVGLGLAHPTGLNAHCLVRAYQKAVLLEIGELLFLTGALCSKAMDLLLLWIG